jgi:hypothetical protein
VKPAYDLILPKGPGNAAYRKRHPASQFTRGVAQLLVGEDLDAEMLQAYRADNTPQNIRLLHSLKPWKEEFYARLQSRTAGLATDPRVQQLVRAAMDRVSVVLAQADAQAPAPREDGLVVLE